MTDEDSLNVLRFFLSMPLIADPVIEHFAAMRRAGAQYFRYAGEERYVYIPATRQTAVLLVAHADTVAETTFPTELHEVGDVIRNADPNQILGADNRAGCAIVQLLGLKLGHGMLITDGEENGQIGAKYLIERCPELAMELQERYQFMVEFDYGECGYSKCYNVGTDEFRAHLKAQTGLWDAGRDSYTDICTLAQLICGVNFSSGYYEAHSHGEYLKKSEWLQMLKLVAEKLDDESFLLKFWR